MKPSPPHNKKYLERTHLQVRLSKKLFDKKKLRLRITREEYLHFLFQSLSTLKWELAKAEKV